MSAAGETRTPPIARPAGEGKRLSLLVHRRRLAVILLLILPVVGAAIGAALRTPPADRFRAVATLVPPPSSPGGAPPEETSGLLGGLVRAGAVRPESLVLGTNSAARGSVTTSLGSGGSLAITARARSSADAQAIANSVGVQLVSLGALINARASAQGGIVLGDFTRSLDGWGASSAFSSAPRSLALDHLTQRFGAAELAVRCGRSPGCGVAREIPYAVLPGVTYSATLWVRATGAPVSIDLVLGRGAHEYASSVPVTVTGNWTRVSLSWTPKTLSSIAELDVQRAGGPGAAFDLGAAVLRDPTLPGAGVLRRVSDREATRLFAADLSDTLLPARPDGVVSTSTLLWAAGGLLAGLLLALAGLGAGRLAAHRKQ